MSMTVKQKQSILTYFGYDLGLIDGIPGVKFGDAVESFQRDNGLLHDRIFGEKTEEKARYNFNNDIFKPAYVSLPEKRKRLRREKRANKIAGGVTKGKHRDILGRNSIFHPG